MDSARLARIAGAILFTLSSAWTSAAHAATDANAPALAVSLWADRDDDDADGLPDGEGTHVSPLARVDLVPVAPILAGSRVEVLSGQAHARVVTATGVAVPWTDRLPRGGFWQGLSPGRVEIAATDPNDVVRRVVIGVGGIDMRDGVGSTVDMARSHASLERAEPIRIEGPPDAPYDDFDALRVVVSTVEDAPAAPSIEVQSVGPSGLRVDSIAKLPLERSACARAADGVMCWASAPLRFVVDDEDRNHPLVKDRSIKAAVGGAIVFRHGSRKAQMIRVLGPRSSPAGPIGLLRAKLRAIVVRVVPGGAPAIGGDEAGAIGTLRNELASASAIWGQCGVTFGDPLSFDVRVVDPPPPHLVALGDGLGVPASGGEIHLRVDGRSLALATHPGESPDAVAVGLEMAAERAGLPCRVSPNAPIAPGLGPSVDVSFRRLDGAPAMVERDALAPLSTDKTLVVRVGSVDLSDGLDHFTDADSMAGTLEERTLLKGLEDAAPGEVRVVVVPLFRGGGRIGESFIASDLSSVRSSVLLDRGGVRARKSSFTLAHELGHVLMDLPGHPDDYGVDTPTLLMDSDAAEQSAFGPRRISLDECARVVRQSGPASSLPLLTGVSLRPVPSR